jgi:hypothetical protein
MCGAGEPNGQPQQPAAVSTGRGHQDAGDAAQRARPHHWAVVAETPPHVRRASQWLEHPLSLRPLEWTLRVCTWPAQARRYRGDRHLSVLADGVGDEPTLWPLPLERLRAVAGPTQLRRRRTANVAGFFAPRGSLPVVIRGTRDVIRTAGRKLHARGVVHASMQPVGHSLPRLGVRGTRRGRDGRLTPYAVLIALAVIVGAGSSASARPASGCHPRGSHTIVATPALRVFKRASRDMDGTFTACLVSRGSGGTSHSRTSAGRCSRPPNSAARASRGVASCRS